MSGIVEFEQNLAKRLVKENVCTRYEAGFHVNFTDKIIS